MGRLLAGGLAIAAVAGGAVAIWLVAVDAADGLQTRRLLGAEVPERGHLRRARRDSPKGDQQQ